MNWYYIFKKELRSYFNSPVAYIVIITFLLISGWFFTSSMFLINEAQVRSFFDITPLIFVFFAPAITMKLIAEERKEGTMEFITTLPVKDTDILLGKLLAAIALLTVSVLLTVPYPLSISSIGDLDAGQAFAGYLGLILMGASFLSIGLFASSITSNQIVAFILSFLFCFALFLIGKMLPFIPDFIVPVFEFISIDFHFENIARGVIDSRDIIYYFSVILFFFYLSKYSLNSRRW